MPAPTDMTAATRRPSTLLGTTPSMSKGRDRGAEPLRRKRAQPLAPTGSPRRRRIVNALLIFSAVVLLVDALVGDTGFVQRIRARRQVQDAEVSLAILKRQNAETRDYIERLREDSSLIEAVAREEMGLIRPGELLFIIRDAQPAAVN
jgi:cell division protein FtsB